MSSTPSITLRYRSAGHVRFQVPAALCATASRRHIVAGLQGIEGVYRVDFYSRQRKLSIRFIPSLCRQEDLAEHLSRIGAEATAAEPAASCCASSSRAVTSGPRRKASLSAPTRWLGEKLSAAREAVISKGFPARRTAGGPTVPWIKESTVIEFLNDALVLFLIRIHWHMITQHWLRQPWRYRYEWMAAFYLIYLLVRSRRPKKS